MLSCDVTCCPVMSSYQGTHTGNAEGFKISTLLKLTEPKANKSRITLLHHILQEVEQSYPDLLNLPDDLEMGAKAAGLNLESLQCESSALIKQLKNSEQRLSCSSEDLKEQYLTPIQESLQALEMLHQLLSSLEDKKTHLSVYLCEDSSSFSIEELFNTIRTFRGLFLRAIQENESRRLQERRRTQQEEERKRKGDTYKFNHPEVIQGSLAVDKPDLFSFSQSEKSAEPPVRTHSGSPAKTNKSPPDSIRPSGPSASPAAADTEGDQNPTRVQDFKLDTGPDLDTTDGSPLGGKGVQAGPDESRENVDVNTEEDSAFEEITSFEVRMTMSKDDPAPRPAKRSMTSHQGGAKHKTWTGCVSH
nr:inverted formin-2-like isoform X2 [Labrus bergylta]